MGQGSVCVRARSVIDVNGGIAVFGLVALYFLS